jgi:CYTH domain-containing protein
MTAIGLVQRKRWFRVAEHAALTMKSIASNMDEKEIRVRLNELKRAVDEAKFIEQSRSKNNKQPSN